MPRFGGSAARNDSALGAVAFCLWGSTRALRYDASPQMFGRVAQAVADLSIEQPTSLSPANWNGVSMRSERRYAARTSETVHCPQTDQ